MAAPKKRRPTAAEQEYAAATRANDAQYGRTRQVRGAVEKAGNAVGGLFGAPYAGKRAVTSPPGLAYQRMLMHDSDKRAFAAADALDRERAAQKGSATVAQPKKKKPAPKTAAYDPRQMMAADTPSSHAMRDAQNDQIASEAHYRPSLAVGEDPAARVSRLQSQVDKERFDRGAAARATQTGFAQHLGTPGGKPAAQPKKPRAASTVPPPAKIDPVSGRSLSRGNPVPTAYSGSPADRSGLFQSSALGAARATFKPPYLGAKGRVPDAPPAPRAVRDPVSGLPLKKGNPVHTAYSGDMNSRVALGLRTAGTAVGMAMKPNYLGAKGRVPNDTPAAIPPARAPQVPTVDSVSRAKPNSPGYEDFPQSLAPGKKKRARP